MKLMYDQPFWEFIEDLFGIGFLYVWAFAPFWIPIALISLIIWWRA